MIYRLTNKLAKKIKEAPNAAIEPGGNPFIDWAAHHFIADRTHYILLTNTHSFLSCVMYSKGITDDSSFISQANQTIRDCLVFYGFEFIYESLVVPEMHSVEFSKIGSRKTNGIMNDMIFHAKSYLYDEPYAPYQLSNRLNRIPFSTLKFTTPLNTFSNLQANPNN